MKTRFVAVCCGVVLALSGCVSTSGSVGLQDGRADKIIEGKSTLAEVRDLLGEPAAAQTTEKGEKVWSYYWSESKIYPVLGTNKSSSRTLNIRFAKNGVVISKDMGQSNAQF